MSIALWNAVWKASMPSTRKLVALSLADQANDSGECYPSVPMIAQRCGLSDRAVRGSIRDLESSGVLLSDRRTGRSTVYLFADPGTWCRGNSAQTTAEPRNVVPPLTSLPRQDVPPTPAAGAGSPRNVVPHTPERSAAITTIEPPIESPVNQKRAAPKLALPDWLPADTWADWCAYRKVKGGWTDRAKQLSIRSLDRLRAQGHEPRAVIENAIEFGWAGLYPPKARAGPPGKPSVAEKFAGKTYTGTPEHELPAFLRSDAA